MKTMLYAGETVQIAQERSAEKAALWVATPQEELHLSMWSGDQNETPFSAEIPLDAVFASGRDRLAEIALADGEPKRERVRALLPPIGDGYAVLGGQASWSAYTVTPAGEVYLQSTGGGNDTFVLFHPAQIDAQLGEIRPSMALLDGELPILLGWHVTARRSLEWMHFVEPQDTDRNPALWTWAAVWDGERRQSQCLLRSSYSRHCVHRPVEEKAFWETFCAAVLHWRGEFSRLCAWDLPECDLPQKVRAMLGTVYTTFAADHPHYGHAFYGQETHDWFPPTMLSYVEAMARLESGGRARRALEHFLAQGLDAWGQIAYRQGEGEVHGASAAEYGQWLDLLERWEAALSPRGWLEAYLPALERMGGVLMQRICPCAPYPDLRLISMCAEADTNGRVHVYAHNNLWAARGLLGLARILARYGRNGAAQVEETARRLLRDTREALRRETVASRFGDLVPFRLGYPATPHTLSNCRDTFFPMEDAQYAAYAGHVSWCREDHARAGEQDYLENCYANYRYYLEMLSSGLLSEAQEKAIDAMRSALGGEMLGMTRLMDRLDDWPVDHFARYLLRTGQRDRYLLLLYAHLEHHGNGETGVYFEQRHGDGRIAAPDCVPCALTVPLMLAWMFAVEDPEGGELSLLRGVPDSWLRQGFSVRGLQTRWGSVRLQMRGGTLEASLPVLPAGIVAAVYLGEKRVVLPAGATQATIRSELLGTNGG